MSLRRYRERDGRQRLRQHRRARACRRRSAASSTAVLGLDDVPAAAPAEPAPRRARARAARGERAAVRERRADARARPRRPTPDRPGRTRSTRSPTPTASDGLYASGDLGAGVTVALYELEPYTASDVAQFQSCFGTSATVTNVAVDGGPGSPAGLGPRARDRARHRERHRHRAVEHGRRLPGPEHRRRASTTRFSAIVNDEHGARWSATRGACASRPTRRTSPIARAENTLLRAGRDAGPELLVASGDAGSDGCDGSPRPRGRRPREPAVRDRRRRDVAEHARPAAGADGLERGSGGRRRHLDALADAVLPERGPA